MSKSAQKHLFKTKDIKNPNTYIQALQSHLKPYFLSEEQAVQWKGQWRKKLAFKSCKPKLHLEIGTGTGKHFSQLCSSQNQDCFVGIEIKYKPLVQTIKALKDVACQKAKVIRYNARYLEDLFEKEELNDVYIYFPDPWPKTKNRKHRLLTLDFAKKLYLLQQNKSLLKLRMDSKEYFLDSVQYFKKAGYKILDYTEDFYKACPSSQNKGEAQELKKGMTLFEKIFFTKQIPIKHASFQKI